MRGIAVSEVLIRGTLDSNQAQIHGVLKDGTEFDFVLPTPSLSQDDKNKNTTPTGEPGDGWIGKETPCGWWVKAKLGKEEPSYVLVKGSGHKVDYKTISLSQLTTLFTDENPTTHSASL